MPAQTPHDAIVVGIDASPDSDRAVGWAVQLASATRQPVHFVHVQPSPPQSLLDDGPPRGWATAGQEILDAAVAKAESVGLTASSENIADTGRATAEALVAASSEAAMLVVGARGHGGYTGLLMGSVSQHAARQAHCPVVTVRRPAKEDASRVVVGVDHSEGAQDALELACRLASAQGAPVTAIHAWRAPSLHGAGVALPMPADTGRAIAHEEQRLAEQLAPWRRKYPDLRIAAEVVPGHAGPVLTDASEQAGLVVVGRRGLGAFAGMLLGSVSQSVLHHARCPVAVAH